MADEVIESAQVEETTAPVEAEAPAETPAEQPAELEEFKETPWTDVLPEDLRPDVEGLQSMEDLKAALKRGMEYQPATDIEQLVTKAPEGVTIDEGMNKAFRELGVKIGLTASQAQALVDFEAQQSAALAKAAAEEGTEALRKQWGQKYDQNCERATKAMLQLDQQMGNRLSAALGESGLKNSPILVEAFSLIGSLISEDSLAGGSSGSSGQIPAETGTDMYRSFGFR